MRISIKAVVLLLSIFFIRLRVEAGEEKYLDGKTKDIYSAKTTLYTTIPSVKYNLSIYREVDDNLDISQLHRFLFTQKNLNHLQNLGINGTASKYLYPQLHYEIGVTSGYNVYDILFPKKSALKFYDAKSPYADLVVTLARYGSFYGDVCFSRNVNQYWNLNVAVSLMMSQKEFLENQHLDSSDRSVISNGLELSTSFRTPGEDYKLYLSLHVMKHRVREPCGVYVLARQVDARMKEENLLNFKAAAENKIDIVNRVGGLSGHFRSNPETADIRKALNLYHEFSVWKDVWLYHEAELGSLKNYFEYRNREKDAVDDLKLRRENSKNDKVPTLLELGQKDAMRNSMALGFIPAAGQLEGNFLSYYDAFYLQNEIGTKFLFWDNTVLMPYYKRKDSWHHRGHGKAANKFLPETYRDAKYVENYVGLYSRRELKIILNDHIDIKGEYLFGGMYSAHLGYGSEVYNISLDRQKYKPSLLATEYIYPFANRQWAHNFVSPITTQATAQVIFSTKSLDIIPTAAITWIDNPIVFRQKNLDAEQELALNKQWYSEPKDEFRDIYSKSAQANPTPICEPEQQRGRVYVGSLGTNFNFKFGSIGWNNNITLADEIAGKTDLIRFPKFLANSMIFYTKTNDQGNGAIHTGIDVHYKSEYRADGYDPVTQQFFLQDRFKVYAYPVIDLFLNFRVGSFSMFFKWSHLNQYFPDPPGYFATPFYPGQNMALDIGIKWSLFD